MNPLRRLVRKFGFDIRRIPRDSDLADYVRLFGEGPARERRFYNIGAGPFSHPCWTNIDMAGAAGHIYHDLMSLQPVPVDDGTAELVYCSHVLDHLNDEAVRFVLRDIRRILKPGGTVRVITQNTMLTWAAWRRNDRDFFYWIADHDANGHWRKTNLKMPLSQATLSQVFLEDFASTASAITVKGAERRIEDEELEKIFTTLPLEEALDYCTARCPAGLQSEFPYHRMNWFSGDKMIRMLKEAGFADSNLSAYLQSTRHVFRNDRYFDTTLPRTSLYAEATG